MNSTNPPIKLACIIDDDDIYINLVKKIIDIKKLSQSLLVFKNGREALDYFSAIIENINQEAFPEIILLDLNMPVMDGWNFLKQFAEIKAPKNLKPIIYVVSSSMDPDEIEKAKSFSLVTDYLIKPVDLQEFEAIFNRESA